MRNISLVLILLLFAAGPALADDKQTIAYDEQIKPIFRQYCWKCHGEDEQKADINLAAFGSILKGGSGGKIVVPGRASASLLFEVITHEDPEVRMPPNSPPLPTAQVELIRRWIDEGLRESSASQSLAASRDLNFKPSADATAAPSGPPPMPQKLPDIELAKTIRPLPVLAMAASPAAPLLACSAQEHIQLIDLASRTTLGNLPFAEGEPHVLRFSRDGKVLLAAGGRPVQSGRVVLYDVVSGRRLAAIGDETDAVLAADLSPNQELVALGGSGKVVKVYSTVDGALRYKLTKHTNWITALAFSPDGKQLATADRAGGMHLWDASSGAILLTLAEHKASIGTLSWRSDGRLLASGGEDGLLVWWDASDGWPAISKVNAHPPVRPPGVYGKLPGGILCVSFGPRGQLASAGRDRVVRWWDPSGRQLKTFSADGALVTQVTVSHDGRTLIAGDAAGQLHFWTLE
jgi:WD40 repeat protein